MISAQESYTKEIEKIGLAKGISRKQLNAFRAFVDLDNLREQPFGFQAIFKIFCEKGNSSWLNPGFIWNRWEALLGKYQADRKLLIHFRNIMEESVNLGISPHSVFRYLVSPRILKDYNWRNWESEHIPAIFSLLAIIAELKKNEKFQNQFVKDSFKNLSTDIVLTKYIGFPLAYAHKSQLSDPEFQSEYLALWRKIEFNNSIFLRFLKLNIFPILKKLANSWDTKQIISLLEKLPNLEFTLASEFSDNEYKWRKVPSLSIYSQDFEAGYQLRESKGFHKIDFYREIYAYVSIIESLSKRYTGIFMLDFLSRRLVLYKDINTYNQIVELIESLKDKTGLMIYYWHFRKFFKLSQEERQSYPKYISDQNGVDPDYSIIYEEINERELSLDVYPEIFEQQKKYTSQILQDLQLEYLQDKKMDITLRTILKEYLIKLPDPEKETVNQIIDDILFGRDRNWNEEQMNGFDSIYKKLFSLLRGFTIRGISSYDQFSIGMNAGIEDDNFSNHWKNFKEVYDSPSFHFNYEFYFKKKEAKDTNKKEDEQIRSKINLNLLEQFHNLTIDKSSVNLATFLSYFQIHLRKMRQSIQDLKSKSLNSSDEKVKSKVDKSIKNLEMNYSNLAKLLNYVDNSKDPIKRFACIILFPNFYDIKDSETIRFYNYLIESNPASKELKFLNSYIEEDTVIDRISLHQIESMCKIIEDLSITIRSDSEMKSVLEEKEDNTFHKLIQPFSLIKSSSINEQCIDAAIKKLFSYKKMVQEKGKWIDAISKPASNSKTNPEFNYYIVLNKSPFDSYFGNMGGTCLANSPTYIKNKRLFNFRITDLSRRDIMGSILGFFVNEPIKRHGIHRYLSAFAINPLNSFLKHLGNQEKILFYLHIRHCLEKFAIYTKTNILLAGADGTHGLISEYSDFASVIIHTEKKFKSTYLMNAKGANYYYSPQHYAHAFHIIDPTDKNTFHASRILSY